jgi:uncharacterized protein YjiK
VKFALLILLTVLAGASSAQQLDPWIARYDLGAKHPTSHRLPRSLREASGLAVVGSGHLLAHNDEQGVVYEIDPASGTVLGSFSLGHFTPEEDFEGIAAKADTVFLVTSDGRLFRFRQAPGGSRVAFTVLRTPLTSANNVEGLEYDPASDCLLLACKGRAGLTREEQKRWKDYRAVYAFSLRSGRLENAPRFLLPVRLLGGHFNPSGIARHPLAQTFFVLAAQGSRLAEVSPSGELLGVQEIRKQENPNPEGIAFLADGTLVLVNDADTKQSMTLYVPRPARQTTTAR